jgi:hypothetical protein
MHYSSSSSAFPSVCATPLIGSGYKAKRDAILPRATAAPSVFRIYDSKSSGFVYAGSGYDHDDSVATFGFGPGSKFEIEPHTGYLKNHDQSGVLGQEAVSGTYDPEVSNEKKAYFRIDAATPLHCNIDVGDL